MSPRKKSAQEVGKDFESWVQGLLQEIQSKEAACFLRLYDTHSAGAYLPAQPGDHILVCGGVANLIECKSSENHDTMTRKFITDSVGNEQAAFVKIWNRAKAGTHYLFLDQVNNEVEHWDGMHIAEVCHTPRMPPDKAFCTRVPKDKEAVKNLIKEKMKWGI